MRLQKCLKQRDFANEIEVCYYFLYNVYVQVSYTFLKKCRNRMVGTGKLLHLTDLLIKPIQRICKYPLILKVRN